MTAYWRRVIEPALARDPRHARGRHRLPRGPARRGRPARRLRRPARGGRAGATARCVVDRPYESTVELAGRGLLLVPVAFAWPQLWAMIDPPWQPAVVYAPRGVATLWEPAEHAPGRARRPARPPPRRAPRRPARHDPGARPRPRGQPRRRLRAPRRPAPRRPRHRPPRGPHGPLRAHPGRRRARGRGALAAPRCDLPRHPLAVAARAHDEHRAEGVLERQPGEEEPGAALRGPALLLGVAVVAERQRRSAPSRSRCGSPCTRSRSPRRRCGRPRASACRPSTPVVCSSTRSTPAARSSGER